MWYLQCMRRGIFQQPALYRSLGKYFSNATTAIKGNRGGDESDFEAIRKFMWQSSGGKITLSKDEATGVAIICLKRPEKRNALSGQMLVQLRDHVEELERWKEGKAVIVCGDGNFCAGGDLNYSTATGAAQGPAGLYTSTWMQNALTRLQGLSLFSVGVVTGPCLGGGAEISVFCDYIIAGDDLKYGFLHGRLGIITAFGGGTRLASRIGYQKDLDLLLTAKILRAEELVELGLAECVVPASEALAKTKEWVGERLQHHRDVIRAMKDTMYKASVSSYADSLSYERDRFAPFWGSEFHREALLKNAKVNGTQI